MSSLLKESRHPRQSRALGELHLGFDFSPIRNIVHKIAHTAIKKGKLRERENAAAVGNPSCGGDRLRSESHGSRALYKGPRARTEGNRRRCFEGAPKGGYDGGFDRPRRGNSQKGCKGLRVIRTTPHFTTAGALTGRPQFRSPK